MRHSDTRRGTVVLIRHQPLPFGQDLLAGLLQAFEIRGIVVFDLHIGSLFAFQVGVDVDPDPETFLEQEMVKVAEFL